MEQVAGRNLARSGKSDEREKDEAAEQRVEKQDRNDGIAAERAFLENIVATQQGGTEKSEG
jgi:hypothetical protein